MAARGSAPRGTQRRASGSARPHRCRPGRRRRGAVPAATSVFIFSRRIAARTAAWRNASPSVDGSARPAMSSFSAGRSASALPSVSMRFCAIGGQGGAACREGQRRQLFAATEHGGQQRERCRHRLGDQIDDHLHDDAAHRELRIVERARDRQPDVDDAARILEQGDGEEHRQLGGRRTLDPRPERAAGRAPAGSPRRACDSRPDSARRT